MQVSIDVVIPSFRLDERFLLPILRLPKPQYTSIKFYLVCDNPAVRPSPQIQDAIDNETVFLLINDTNLGAAQSRNKGMKTGSGDWVLFLDDDIVAKPNLLQAYASAAVQYPDEIGFIGVVQLPQPKAAFTQAIKLSGAMDIFSIAERKRSYAWGATANTMVKRSAVDGALFSLQYPKWGGGEDVDFFLKVRENNAFQNYKTLPEAVVTHPWWNAEQPNYQRTFRYGMGNSLLPQLNPKYAYRDFLNTPEMLLMAFILSLVLPFFYTNFLLVLLTFIASVVVIEILANIVQALKRKAKTNLAVFYYLIALRIVYQTGLLWGNLRRGRIIGIGERFNDNGSLKKQHFYRFNSYKITKCVLYFLLILWILKSFK